MKGHVKLGTTVAGLREYMLTDPNGLGMQLSNQMAAKLGQGAGKYDDLQNWSAWVMDNWAAGAGSTDAEGGGFLFGTADSRVPRQLILPPAHGVVTDTAFDSLHRVTPADLTTTAGSITSVAAWAEHSWSIKARLSGATSQNFWLYAKFDYGTSITVKLYNGITLLSTDTHTARVQEKNHQWYYIPISYNVVAGTTYTVKVSGSFDWEVWTCSQYSSPFFIYQDDSPFGFVRMLRFNSNLYALTATGALRKYNTVTKKWDTVAGSPASCTDLIVFNGSLHIGRTASVGNFYTMTTGEVFSAAASTGEKFYKWNGYLYKTVDDGLYYSADGTTWTGAFKAEPGEDIQAMAGMGNDLYFANKNGLYRLAPGDTVFGVVQWGKYAAYIGNEYNVGGMVAWQGDIYIAVDGQIVRYTANGQVSEVWHKDNGDLPLLYIGRITSLGTMNNYLVATVLSDNGTAYNTYSSVWLWNKQGWHCIAIPPSGECFSTYHDKTLGRLWLSQKYNPVYIMISDMAQNPYSLTTSRYMPDAWVETGWFDGNLIEIKKDFESVYCTGDNLSSNQNLDIYWVDDESGGLWESLGTVDTNREELRWTDAATRPNSRQIKLAIRFNTNDIASTPKLEAVRLKYMSMLLDRYRWTLPIAVSLNQEMLDNTLNSYTLAQQVTHIHSLINAVAPIYFEDVDGTQYEVKVMGASRSIRDFEYRNPSATKVYKLVYNVVIEQVVSNINT